MLPLAYHGRYNAGMDVMGLCLTHFPTVNSRAGKTRERGLGEVWGEGVIYLYTALSEQVSLSAPPAYKVSVKSAG